MAEGLELRRYAAADVPDQRDDMLDVHADANAELLDHPFTTVERFAERLDSYVTDPAFTLVAGYVDGKLIGYAFGGVHPDAGRWWRRLIEPAEPDVVGDTSALMFSFREILVRKAHQGRGYGRRLHDALLADRPEVRATLLVRPENPARDLYLRWGWRQVGRTQPFPDAPILDAMVRDLLR